MENIDMLEAFDNELLHLHFRHKLLESLDSFIRGLSLSVTSLVHALGLINKDECERVQSNIYALTYNYANLEELARALARATEPGSDTSNTIKQWKELSDKDKSTAIIKNACMTPSDRKILIDEFNKNAATLDAFSIFEPDLKRLREIVEDSNKAYTSLIKDVDLEIFEQDTVQRDAKIMESLATFFLQSAKKGEKAHG